MAQYWGRKKAERVHKKGRPKGRRFRNGKKGGKRRTINVFRALGEKQKRRPARKGGKRE